MSIPTIEEITNLYLYKKINLPDNRLDPNIITDGMEEPFKVKKSDFMIGSGRFINASDFSLVSKFF